MPTTQSTQFVQEWGPQDWTTPPAADFGIKRLSSWLAINIIHKRKNKSIPDSATSVRKEDQPKLLVLPYIRGPIERIEWTVLPLNIKAVFQTQSNIRQRVMKVKGRPKNDEIKGVIYSIPCECGSTYIVQTGKNLHTRLQEHKREVCKIGTNNSIAVHAIMTNHSIQWEKHRRYRQNLF